MWCYQMPGFEDLLLTELQRQQQCSQFCDTVLNAEGVSVPAHSCVLSAMSPDISSALSSTPAPRAGQRHLLEFHSLRASTLLHLVRLLYSGEMAGETEREKQEAISAAAKLGIYGLVEVTKGSCSNRNREGVRQYAEVGVQTEAEENEERHESRKDVQTLTDELTAYPPPLDTSLEITDMASFQSLGQMDSHLIFPQIVPLVYPPVENRTPHPSIAPPASIQDCTAAGSSVSVVTLPYTSVPYTSLPCFSNEMTQCAVDPQGQWAGPQGAEKEVAADEDWEDERIERFQGDIPGFISCFLNPDQEEGYHRGRAGRRQRARKASTGEKRASRPQERARGRERRGSAQVVQEVKLGKKQKLFLHRWGRTAHVTGQGGGAVGRRLDLKSRELLKTEKSRQRRGRGKVWELSQSADKQLYSEGRGGNSQRGRKRSTQQLKQVSAPVCSAQKTRPTSATLSAPLSLTPAQIRNVQPSSGSSRSLHPCPSPNLQSPASSHVSPAPSLLHTTCLPPLDPPPQQDQPEHIDRLLEEVMMGLDIIPNTEPQSQRPPPGSSSSCTVASNGNTLAQNKQQYNAVGDQTSTEVDLVAQRAASASSTNAEVPVLQQQCEGELADILDHFLQLFDQHFESSGAREEKEMDGETSTKTSQPHAVLSQYEKTKITAPHAPHPHNTQHQVRGSETTELQNDETEKRRAQSSKDSARRDASVEHAAETRGKAVDKRRKKRRAKHYLFSLEKRAKTRKPAADAKAKIMHDREARQLQQMPVVKLQRRGLLPATVTLEGNGCQSVEDKRPAKTKTGPLSKKYRKRNKPAWQSTKTYPIRSRLNESHRVMDNMPVIGAPLLDTEPPSAHTPDSPKKNGQQLSSSKSVSSEPPVQLQPVDPCGTREQREKDQERHEEESGVRRQEEEEEEEALARRGQKRRAESNEYAYDDDAVAKTFCFDQMLTCEPCFPRSESEFKQATVELKEVFDPGSLPLTNEEDLRGEKQNQKTVWSEIKLRETERRLTESSTDDVTDIEEDRESSKNRTPSHPAKALIVASSGNPEEDEDIDVTESSSPIPDPVSISWTESSEEDQNVDIVEEDELTSFETCIAVT